MQSERKKHTFYDTTCTYTKKKARKRKEKGTIINCFYIGPVYKRIQGHKRTIKMNYVLKVRVTILYMYQQKFLTFQAVKGLTKFLQAHSRHNHKLFLYRPAP